jgi:uncharacterized membrane protein YeaQ/YmgE (transglycosylase-associated protein family)
MNLAASGFGGFSNSNHITTMGILSWIFLGLVAGALAKFIMPGKDPGGIFVTILIGIAGGVVGGFLGTFIGLGHIRSFDFGGIFIATAGAVLLLVIYRMTRKKQP